MKIVKGSSAPTSSQKGSPTSPFGFGILMPKQQNRFVVEYEIDSDDAILARQTIAVTPNFDLDCLDVILEDDIMSDVITHLQSKLTSKEDKVLVKMLDGADIVIATWKYEAKLQTFHYQKLDYSTGDKVTILARFVISDWEITR